MDKQRMIETESLLGKIVTVQVDRPMGSVHPSHPDIRYPVNYGYVPGYFGGDGEEQDAYVLGVDGPVDSFSGVVIAVVERLDDAEDKWVVAPPETQLTRDQIARAVSFQERFFKTRLITQSDLEKPKQDR